MVTVSVSEPDGGSRGRKAEEVIVNFDSGRRIRRMERSKERRQKRNERRWASLKETRERQRRLGQMAGVTG